MPFDTPTGLGRRLRHHSCCVTVLYFSPYVFLYNIMAMRPLPKLLWDLLFILLINLLTYLMFQRIVFTDFMSWCRSCCFAIVRVFITETSTNKSPKKFGNRLCHHPWSTPCTTPNCSSDSSCTFAQLHCRLPIGYNGTLHVCPQNYPFLWTDPQTQLPASSLDSFDLPSQTAFISDQPFCHNSPNRQTDQQMVGGNVWWL